MKIFWVVEVRNGEAKKCDPPGGMVVCLTRALLYPLHELPDKEASQHSICKIDFLRSCRPSVGEMVPLFLSVDEQNFALGTLCTEHSPDVLLAIVLNKTFTLSHNRGSGSVYFYGFTAVNHPLILEITEKVHFVKPENTEVGKITEDLSRMVVDDPSSAMNFWGVEVKSGVPFHVYPAEGTIVHIYQAAMGLKEEDKKTGKKYQPATLLLETGGHKRILGVICLNQIPQITLNLVLKREFVLGHSWPNGSVYFFGFTTSKRASDRLSS